MRASLGRRFVAICLDWFACYFIVVGFSGGFGRSSSGRPAEVLALFAFEYALLLLLQGQSLGHRIMRLRVVNVSGGERLSITSVLIRTILMMAIVTAITFDDDGRGIHERLSGTATIRY